MNKELPSHLSSVYGRKTILIILVVAFFLRLLVIFTSGNRMTLYSDDLGYIRTAIDFMKTGNLTYWGAPHLTVFMMPGMPVLLNLIFSVTGYTETGLLLARIPFVLLGTLNVYGVYLVACEVGNVNIANLSALFAALFVPQIAMDNLFMTETPFTTCLLFMTLYLLRFFKDQMDKNFLCALTLYLMGLMFKPTIGLYPMAFIQLALKTKISIKLLLKRGIYAAAVLILVLTPWITRNYIALGEIVPFTGNQGDSLLLGTFQGYGYPEGTYSDVNQPIMGKPRELGKENLYFAYKEKSEVGKQRLQQWFFDNPGAFLYSNLIYKPYLSIRSTYYPVKVFNIPSHLAVYSHRFLIAFSLVGMLGVIIKKDLKMVTILMGILLLIYVNGFYFAFTRYTLPYMQLICIFSACGLYYLYELFQSVKKLFILQ